jgi:hypothetical protein
MFQLRRFKRIRLRTDYIVLIPSTLLIEEKFFIDPLVINSGNMYTWGIWEKYFLHSLKKEALPCHYFTELVGEDYVTYKGLPDFQPSYFMEDLVSAGIIDYKYRNSLVVVVGENFNLHTLEKRLAEQLASKVLSPLLRINKLHPERIKFIDECFKEDWKTSLKYSTLDYKLTESKYFDINILLSAIFKYKYY